MRHESGQSFSILHSQLSIDEDGGVVEVRPGYKQTEVGVIPEDWEPRGLLSTVSIANGQVDPRREPFRSMVLVAPDHIESGTGKLLAERTAAEQRAVSGKYVFGSGDIVYSKIRPYLKKAILADFAGLCSADMYPLRPVGGVVGGYIVSVLLAHRFTKYAESVSVRSGMPKINRAELADFALALPPFSEQRAIAAALSDVDALLGGLDRLVAKKRDLKQAAMQQLLTGLTRLPGFHGEWEVVKAGDIGRFQGGTGFPVKFQGATSGEYPLFKVSDMNNVGNETFMETANNYISEDMRGQLGATAFRAGTIVFAKVGAAVFLERKKILAKVSCLDNNMAAFTIDARRAHSRFVHCVLLNTKLGSLVSTTALPSLSGGVLASIELRIPPLPEQGAIATVHSDMDTELSALEARRDKTRALKQGIMQELLTGRTRLVSREDAKDAKERVD